jgi:Protein of unknown function (DUF2795)
VTPQRAVELQTLLEGVPLPARKRDLIAYAGRQDPDAVRDLDALPDREYRSLDEVGERLSRVQPRTSADTRRPRAESGDPPGRDAYTDPQPEPGAIRPSTPPDNPPQKVLEQQTKAQKDQQDKHKQLG